MGNLNKIFIWGASGQGRVTLEMLKESKEFEVCAFIDSNPNLWGKSIDRIKVIGGEEKLNKLRRKGIKAGYVAIGNNKIRCEVAQFLKEQKFFLVNVIHPKAIIAHNISFGQNIGICIGAIVCTNTVIEDNVLINSGAIVEHDNIIKNGAHITPGVKLAGGVTIGERAFIGIGSTVIQYKKIGNDSVIGAGTVVTKNIPDRVLAIGIPAKIRKYF